MIFFMAGLSAALVLGNVDHDQVAEAQMVGANSGTSIAWSSASFPVENFQTYTSPFGYRSSPDGSGISEFHAGLDMAAPQGSYVRNWWGGQIVEVSDDSNCGTSVTVQSGNWSHVYCHMIGHVEVIGDVRYLIDREGGLQLAEGQVIPTGARIGRVGMTGRTTGPHLHWGLRYDDQWVDPAQVLRAMYSAQQQISQR
jgi:murein DD-endopeptidase MepM/ murein hydrolase activator NlpD